MQQTLFSIPAHDPVWGLPIFGFGWLLILWLVFSGGLLLWLSRRQGWGAETMSHLPTLALVAAAIAFVLPWLVEQEPSGPAGLPIRGYGTMLLLAIVAGVSLATRRARQMGVDPDDVYSLAMWMVAAGIVGARAFYVIEYRDQFIRPAEGGGVDLGATLGEIANVTKGGLVVYGSFIGAAAAAVFFFWRNKLPALAMADLIAPSLMIGLAFGRLGCLLNGCCFGGVCYDLPWRATFPGQPTETPPYAYHHERGMLHGFRLAEGGDQPPTVAEVAPESEAAASGLKSGDRIVSINGRATPQTEQARDALLRSGPALRLELDDGRVAQWSIGALPARSLPVHPTQIYSAIGAALLCLVLWTYYPLRTRDGQVIALMLTLYPIMRFTLEIIRSDEAGQFGTEFSISQWVSMVLLILVIPLWAYLFLRPPHRAWPATA